MVNTDFSVETIRNSIKDDYLTRTYSSLLTLTSTHTTDLIGLRLHSGDLSLAMSHKHKRALMLSVDNIKVFLAGPNNTPSAVYGGA